MRFCFSWMTIFLAGVLLSGCGEDATCKSGETRSCNCAGGGSGTQTCADDEKSWGDCKCTTPQDGGADGIAVDAAPPDGTTGDAPGVDAAADAAPDKRLVDTGPPDAIQGKYSWYPVPTPSVSYNLRQIWGASRTEIYAAGSSGTILLLTDRRSTTKAWANTVSSAASKNLNAVWGSSAQDVFAVGEAGTLVWFEGHSWSALSSGTTQSLRFIWGPSSTEIYAFGEFGTLLHTPRTATPNKWTAVKHGTGSSTFLGVWGTGPKDLHVLGTSGTILHYDGSTWTKATTGTTEHLWAAWGSAKNNAFAVGEGGTVLRYDGSAWKSVTSGTKNDLYDIWGAGASQIFAVGDKGTVLYYDGAGWKPMVSGTTKALHGIWGSNSTDVYAVGDTMTFLRYGPCDCKVSKLCYQKGERDDTGCKVCDPSKSTTSLSAVTGGCSISGKCYKSGDRDPTLCKVCDPSKSTTAWTTDTSGCTISSKCYLKDQVGPLSCQQCVPATSQTSWTLVGTGCVINNTCYAKGARDSIGCAECDPSKNKYAWTPLTGLCKIGGKCYTKGTKHSGGCAECDPATSSTSWTVKVTTHCLISDTCYTSGTKDSIGCASCDPSKNKYAWTPLPGVCKIGGKCYTTGTKHPGGCAECDPSISYSSWTVKGTTHCLINDTCIASGTKDPTTGSCATCQPTKNKYAYTPDAGYCKIDGVCYKDGAKHSGGCAACDTSKTSTAWTPNTASDCVLNGKCAAVCSSTCVDLKSNTSHCGKCSNACSSGQFCIAGVCVTAAPSCLAIKTASPSAPTGVYSLVAGTTVYKAYCDMTSDGGGWTLVARFSNADTTNWIDSASYWYDRTTEVGKPTVRNENLDALSMAFWSVKGDELKIARSDNSTDAALLRTNAKCLNGKTFRDKIKSLGTYKTGAWSSTAVRGTCTAVLGSNYTSTSGFKYATCTGTIGAAKAVSFFADYSAGDGAVMMIGGGGSACNRADHGIAVTEGNDAQFGSTCSGCSLRQDFDDNANSTATAKTYSLNLFVR